MAMTYESLVIQIQTYANRKDAYFVDSIPYFIELAQERINREAKDIGFQKTVNGVCNLGVPTIGKPADWNQTVSLSYGVNDTALSPLFSRTYEFCRTYWAMTNQTAAPMFYADNANNQDVLTYAQSPYNSIFLAPTPDRAYAYKLIYLQRPDVLSGANQTNWLTERAPDLIFYACMVESTPFLKDDERVPVWEAMYNRALQSSNLQTKQRYIDRTSQRDKD